MTDLERQPLGGERQHAPELAVLCVSRRMALFERRHALLERREGSGHIIKSRLDDEGRSVKGAH